MLKRFLMISVAFPLFLSPVQAMESDEDYYRHKSYSHASEVPEDFIRNCHFTTRLYHFKPKDSYDIEAQALAEGLGKRGLYKENADFMSKAIEHERLSAKAKFYADLSERAKELEVRWTISTLMSGKSHDLKKTADSLYEELKNFNKKEDIEGFAFQGGGEKPLKPFSKNFSETGKLFESVYGSPTQKVLPPTEEKPTPSSQDRTTDLTRHITDDQLKCELFISLHKMIPPPLTDRETLEKIAADYADGNQEHVILLQKDVEFLKLLQKQINLGHKVGVLNELENRIAGLGMSDDIRKQNRMIIKEFDTKYGALHPRLERLEKKIFFSQKVEKLKGLLEQQPTKTQGDIHDISVWIKKTYPEVSTLGEDFFGKIPEALQGAGVFTEARKFFEDPSVWCDEEQSKRTKMMERINAYEQRHKDNADYSAEIGAKTTDIFRLAFHALTQFPKGGAYSSILAIFKGKVADDADCSTATCLPGQGNRLYQSFTHTMQTYTEWQMVQLGEKVRL